MDGWEQSWKLYGFCYSAVAENYAVRCHSGKLCSQNQLESLVMCSIMHARCKSRSTATVDIVAVIYTNVYNLPCMLLLDVKGSSAGDH